MNQPSTTKTMLVREVMTQHPICVGGGDSVRTLAHLFDDNNISGVPVVDAQDRLIGVVSKTDILHRCLEGPPGNQPGNSYFACLREGASEDELQMAEALGQVEDLMSADPVTATLEESVTDVAHRMAEERVHRVIVINENRRPIGVVTTLDLLEIFPRV